ncbi:MAG TPA: 3-isopropylmalate dehydrogenase [Candidatus Saccharimonadales bacterium]|nr:3-isopropylmalate dehydrogenase [Candidatus Saccharimonadales bacterium]
MSYEVVALPGDGIGREIVPAAVEVLRAATDALEFEYHPFGEDSMDRYGEPLTPGVLHACREADAVLFGAAGGSQWRPEDADKSVQGLLTLRKEMGLYANLRPVRPHPALYEASPLRKELIAGTSLLIVRELTGGIYFGDKGRDPETGRTWDECAYRSSEIERIAHVAFRAADRQVISIDYGDKLATSRLWREVVTEVGSQYHKHLKHMEVTRECRSGAGPTAVRELINWPARFDVILTENMLGDILSDQAAMIGGSIGLLPSASVGEEGEVGLFEPVHGSAPDIAGRGIANPLATILSGALLLRHLQRETEAEAVERAVDKALSEGLRTRDLGGTATTREATDAVLEHL